jgi:hypothetical protein
MNAHTKAYSDLLAEVQYKHGTSGHRRKSATNARTRTQVQDTVQPSPNTKKGDPEEDRPNDSSN